MNPKRKLRKQGQKVNFRCLFDYSWDYFIKWTFNNNELPKNSLEADNTITLYNLKLQNSGTYTCVVNTSSGGLGKASSKLLVVSKLLIIIKKLLVIVETITINGVLITQN